MKSKASEQPKLNLPNCVSCNKQVTLVALCPQCAGMVCDDCKNAHNTMKPLQEHQVTLFSNLKKEHVNTYISNQQRCPEKFHEKFKLEYYCKTCHKSVCQKCSITTHSTHDKISIEDKAEEIKQSIHQDLDRVNQQKEKFQQELVISEQNLTRLENEIKAAKKEVVHQVDAQIQILQEHKNTMIKTLDATFSEQKAENKEMQKDISANIQRLNALENQGKAVQQENVANFILENQFPERCKEELQKIQDVLNLRSIIRNTASVVYVPRTLDAIQPDLGAISVKSFTDLTDFPVDPSRCSVIELLRDAQNKKQDTEIKCEIVTRNSKGKICYTDPNSIEVQIKDAKGGEVKNEVTETEPGKFIVTFRAKKSPHQILVTVKGEAIGMDSAPKTLCCNKMSFQPCKIFGEKGDGVRKLSGSCSLALSVNEEVLIADTLNHRIVIFNANGRYIRHFGEPGRRDGNLCYPRGVVMCENIILVCDRLGQCGRIQEFKVNGTFIRTIFKQEMVEVNGMCITDEHIVVICESISMTIGSDVAPSVIKLLSLHSGQVVQEMPVPVNVLPMYIAYYNHKYFVSCHTVIYVLDKKGTFFNRINCVREGQKLCEVRGLAFYGSKLLVCDANNHCVQVLTHQGKFITSFGGLGSGKGQMNRPTDIVVTRDGKLLVLENGGNRVQVLQ